MLVITYQVPNNLKFLCFSKITATSSSTPLGVACDCSIGSGVTVASHIGILISLSCPRRRGRGGFQTISLRWFMHYMEFQLTASYLPLPIILE